MHMATSFKSQGALLVIDMLNDFIEEGGALVVPDAKRIVPRIRELLAEARQQEIPVIYITDSHREDDHEFRYWPPHAVSDTWGGKVISDLAPTPGDYIVPKRRYSAFFGTDLEMLLRELKVERIYLAGVLSNICIYATALDAAMRAYGVTVFKDAVASLSEETDRFVFQQLEEVLQAELL